MLYLNKAARAAAVSLAIMVAGTIAQAHEVKIGQLVIGHPWSRQSPMAADVAAGFLTIDNQGTDDDRLISATASITPMVQLHDMKMEGDVMKMTELPEGIPIPAGQLVELKPRSLHVMFMELKAPVKEGDVFTGTLVFEKAGTIDIEYEVLAPDAGMN